MKVIELKHNSKLHSDRSFRDHGDLCEIHTRDGDYVIFCRCDEAKVEVKEVKTHRDLIDEIDTNGNGRITKKEIKEFIKKDEDK